MRARRPQVSIQVWLRNKNKPRGIHLVVNYRVYNFNFSENAFVQNYSVWLCGRLFRPVSDFTCY